MAAESMVFPVPSELVMPFAGYLTLTGTFGAIESLGASLLGSLAGSLLSYWLAMKWGPAVTAPFVRWHFVSQRHLDETRAFFERHGTGAVLAARFIPVVRHLISLPAGYSRMGIKGFVAATAVGAFAWNGILFYAGYALGENWAAVRRTLEPYEIAFVAALVAAGLAFAWRLRQTAISDSRS